MNDDLAVIWQAVRDGRLVFSRHAFEEMAQEDPVHLASVIEDVILTGELIEDYPTAPRGPCCLLLGWLGKAGMRVLGLTLR